MRFGAGARVSKIEHKHCRRRNGGIIMAKLTPTNFASDDIYGWTENQLIASGPLGGTIVTLDVLANDTAIKPRTLFSIDAGNGHVSPTDSNLLTADANGAWESTS